MEDVRRYLCHFFVIFKAYHQSLKRSKLGESPETIKEFVEDDRRCRDTSKFDFEDRKVSDRAKFCFNSAAQISRLPISALIAPNSPAINKDRLRTECLCELIVEISEGRLKHVFFEWLLIYI